MDDHATNDLQPARGEWPAVLAAVVEARQQMQDPESSNQLRAIGEIVRVIVEHMVLIVIPTIRKRQSAPVSKFVQRLTF